MSKEAMKLALEALNLVNLEFVCDGAHHAKKDRHELGDDCPVTARYQLAIKALEEALDNFEKEAAMWGDLFEYKDGTLFWKVSTNRRIKQYSAAGSTQKDGYVRIKINGVNYYAHRIVFALHNGYMPECVDHIDGNRSNNKIENLREANVTLNNWNKKIRSDSKSSHKGVWWHKQSGMWEAVCKVNKKQTTVGRFEKIEDSASLPLYVTIELIIICLFI